MPHDRLLDAILTPDNIRERVERLDEPHIAPLTQWAASVRERLSPCRAATVPEFDPAGGGIEAPVLVLLQDPSRVATTTGLISPDNNDPTAEATTLACADAGLPNEWRVHWNVYPFWLDNPRCPTRRPAVRELTHTFLIELVDRLPNLQVVVAVGGDAQRAWRKVAQSTRHLRFVPASPHPARGWFYKVCNDGRTGRESLTDAFRIAAEVVGGSAPVTSRPAPN